ncbi:hypothetical protein PF007_g6173 [Phytophthora fragariae]|uniref:Copia protein n=1 Tax=Phytophthora fragariae TaxID=53985 RepID=A0A6A3SYA1_9STRA|nr:hypothetical protein PF007_g6173 [Phytophthora fragariae]
MEGWASTNVLTEVLPKTRIDFTLGVNNQAAITLASNPTYSRKTRHIELRFHYVREQVTRKAVSIWKVDGDVNPADLLTKPLGYPQLTKMKQLIGMHPEAELTPREMQRKLHDEKQRGKQQKSEYAGAE